MLALSRSLFIPDLGRQFLPLSQRSLQHGCTCRAQILHVEIFEMSNKVIYSDVVFNAVESIKLLIILCWALLIHKPLSERDLLPPVEARLHLPQLLDLLVHLLVLLAKLFHLSL